MERPLYTPSIKPMIADIELESGDADVDAAALYSQVLIDKAQLARHIRHALQDRSQITLGELCRRQPLQHGLAELVAYLQLAGDTFKTVVDEAVAETVAWRGTGVDGREQEKLAWLPRVIFVR
jgi:phosphoserine phosphatase